MKLVVGYAGLTFAIIALLSYALRPSAREKMPLYKFVLGIVFFVVGSIVLIRSDSGGRTAPPQASAKSENTSRQSGAVYSERYLSLLRKIAALDNQMREILQSTQNSNSLKDLYVVAARAVVFKREADVSIRNMDRNINNDFNTDAEREAARSAIGHVSKQTEALLTIVAILKEGQEKNMPDNEFSGLINTWMSTYRSEQMAGQKDMLFLREISK